MPYRHYGYSSTYSNGGFSNGDGAGQEFDMHKDGKEGKVPELTLTDDFSVLSETR